MDSRRGDDTLASAARGVAARDRRPASVPGAIQDAIGDEIGRHGPPVAPAPVAASRLTPVGRRRSAIRGQLLSRATLRQAMILIEILGPPKALRQRE